MNLNELAAECHQIARDKGFWRGVEPYIDGELTLLQEGHVCKQINHMLTEVWEADSVARIQFDYANDTRVIGNAHYQEELADTAIVLLDLCGYLDVEVSDGYIQDDFGEPWRLIAEFADVFRKHGMSDKGRLACLAGYLLGSLNTKSGNLEDEMRKKMDFNRTRPPRYGVHDAN